MRVSVSVFTPPSKPICLLRASVHSLVIDLSLQGIRRESLTPINSLFNGRVHGSVRGLLTVLITELTPPYMYQVTSVPAADCGLFAELKLLVASGVRRSCSLLYCDGNGRQTFAHPRNSHAEDFAFIHCDKFGLIYWLIWFPSALFMGALMRLYSAFRRSTPVHMYMRAALFDLAWVLARPFVGAMLDPG